MGTNPTRKRARSRSPWRWILGALLLLLLGFAAAAIPMRSVPSDAQNARTELMRSTEALKVGNLRVARRHLASSKRYVAQARESTDGLGATLWSAIPVVGTAVDDVRHLLAALDSSTQVVGGGIDLYPKVLGRRATLVEGKQVDLEALTSVLTSVESVGKELVKARDELAAVSASTPGLGARLAEARDVAADEIVPLADAYERARPNLPAFPGLLGAQGPRNYLVMVKNPAELRYSGGATLVGSIARMRDGKVSITEAKPLWNLPNSYRIRWPKVPGNPFHRGGERISVQNATFNPNWSVSGEELLRGYQAATGEALDGVVAVDVQALARLVAVTAPLETPGFGTLTADNLVTTLVGSYDIYTDQEERRRNNAALVTAFTDRLFNDGQFAEKLQAIGRAAAAREFAMYVRDDSAQQLLTSMRVEGDLSATEGDYLGAFTQNTNISKVDFYQRRVVTSDVTLRPDGSADVRLEVEVHNDTPPYVGPEPDPRKASYQTRWSGVSLAAFLPEQMTLTSLSRNGKVTADPHVGQTLGRPYVRQSFTLAPGAKSTTIVEYTVPNATTESGDGLVYNLAADPQGLVRPAALDITVHLPEGYRASNLPEGWKSSGTALSFKSKSWAKSYDWSVRLAR